MYRIHITKPGVTSESVMTNITDFKKLEIITWGLFQEYAKTSIQSNTTHTIEFQEEEQTLKVELQPSETNVYIDGKLIFNVATALIAKNGNVVIINALKVYETKQHAKEQAIVGEYSVICVKADGNAYRTKIHKATYERLKNEKTLHLHFKEVITIVVGEESGDSYSRVETLNLG